MSTRFYAGIGSRETPEEILIEMTKLGRIFETCGLTLRSGNAEGADQAFASGVESNAQIWLPWDHFQKDFRKMKPRHDYKVISSHDKEAFQSVIEFHPNANNLSEFGCLFMARNYRQVIGLGEPNSEFIVAWTEGGLVRGGTGQALRIAKKYNIDIINMYKYETANEVLIKLNELKHI